MLYTLPRTKEVQENEVKYMLNMSDIFRGYTDTVILAQLYDLDSYGYEINKNVQQATDGALELKEATLYTTFRRLEQAGLILSYWGDENTGARRRYYSITDDGRRLYRENCDDWKKIRAIIDKLLQDKNEKQEIGEEVANHE